MTDPTAPTDDELSLALDGTADAELLARIDASPEAQARLDDLRAASALVSTPVAPLDADTVDDLVATALDTPVAPPRVARRGRRAATPWLVAASVVILMAVGLSLVWAGRGSDDDQASASRTGAASQTADDSPEADSAFSESADGSAAAGKTLGSTPSVPGGHGTETTIASQSGTDLPVLYLGSFASADRLRSATATSFADALKASEAAPNFGSTPTTTGGDEQASTTQRSDGTAPSDASLDRCAEQLQVTLSLKAGPLQRGYATVDDQTVLVYEFAATSARDGKDTTLVAAVGAEACDEVVLFER
jgi:hypothetical protein